MSMMGLKSTVMLTIHDGMYQKANKITTTTTKNTTGKEMTNSKTVHELFEKEKN